MLKRKKRILFIQHTLSGGGAERVLIDILNRFDYSKYEVTLLLVSKDGVYLSDVPSEVKICAIKGPGIERLRPLPKNRIFNNRWTRPFWRIADVWRALGGMHRYDVAISFMEGAAVFYHSLIWPKARKNISWVHTDLLANHYTANYFDYPEDELKTYNLMDKIVFVSDAAKEAFEQLFSRTFPSDVIYNIIEKNKIIQKSAEECDYKKSHKYTICNIGRLTAQKRQDRLLEVIAALIYQYNLDVELLLIGEGELKEELKALAKRLEIDDCVYFLGFQKNPYKYLKQSDLFLLTSDAEGFSLVVAEALCLGIPVVSTPVTGPIELLREDSGILTTFGPSEIAENVNNLLTNPVQMKHYKSQAQLRSGIFDPMQTMRQIEEILND